MSLRAVVTLLFLSYFFSSSGTVEVKEFMPFTKEYVLKNNSSITVSLNKNEFLRPSPLLQMFRNKRALNKKYTAALLAFPFPFGIVGLHRIYLGCTPYVPVVYIASLGGAFGFLPLIDCIVILADKNTEKYVNNKQVFMWIE